MPLTGIGKAPKPPKPPKPTPKSQPSASAIEAKKGGGNYSAPSDAGGKKGGPSASDIANKKGGNVKAQETKGGGKPQPASAGKEDVLQGTTSGTGDKLQVNVSKGGTAGGKLTTPYGGKKKTGKTQTGGTGGSTFTGGRGTGGYTKGGSGFGGTRPPTTADRPSGGGGGGGGGGNAQGGLPVTSPAYFDKATYRAPIGGEGETGVGGQAGGATNPLQAGSLKSLKNRDVEDVTSGEQKTPKAKKRSKRGTE